HYTSHALLSGAVAECRWFKPAPLQALVRQHASGRCDHSGILWKLLMLDAFLRRMPQWRTNAAFFAGTCPAVVAGAVS
ncbi:MAG: hypothetical protein ACRETQ_03790, partial [Gammaproteobacteria bacterium]